MHTRRGAWRNALHYMSRNLAAEKISGNLSNQTEIDFIVTKGNAINAIEVKWEKSAMPKNFKTIRKHYPEIDTRLPVKSDFLGLSNPVAFLSPSL